MRFRREVLPSDAAIGRRDKDADLMAIPIRQHQALFVGSPLRDQFAFLVQQLDGATADGFARLGVGGEKQKALGRFFGDQKQAGDIDGAGLFSLPCRHLQPVNADLWQGHAHDGFVSSR
jgi:hypothetical protein